MPTLEEFLRDLADEGTVITREGARSSECLITVLYGSPVDPPIRLRVTEAALQSLLDDYAAMDLSELWPGVDRRTAGYYLFLVNFDEEVGMFAGKVELIEISTRRGVAGMRTTPRWDWDPDEGRPPHGGGPYAWVPG